MWGDGKTVKDNYYKMEIIKAQVGIILSLLFGIGGVVVVAVGIALYIFDLAMVGTILLIVGGALMIVAIICYCTLVSGIKKVQEIFTADNREMARKIEEMQQTIDKQAREIELLRR